MCLHSMSNATTDAKAFENDLTHSSNCANFVTIVQNLLLIVERNYEVHEQISNDKVLCVRYIKTNT